MNEWKKYHLEDLCSLITDGKHGDCQNEANSGYYFLSVKDISDNRLIYNNARQITKTDFLETHRRTNLEPGDILFTNTGTIGRMAIVSDDPKTSRTTFQKSVAILKPKRAIINPLFLYYLLKFDNARLSELAAGTTQKNLLLRDFRSFTVKIPDSKTQQAIARILSSLDDKIELNRRMNETLEAMARAIFKDWFVDFGPTRAKQEGRAAYLPEHLWSLFPDQLAESIIGLIPKEWRVVTIADIASRIAMGPFGSRIKTENFVSSGVPIIRGNNLKNGFIDDDFVFLTEIKANEFKNSMVSSGDIVFTHRGTLGQVGFIPKRSKHPRYIVSQSQMLLSVDQNQVSPHLIYQFFKSPDGKSALLANVNSTGVPSIARPSSSLKEIKFVLPTKSISDSFEKLIGEPVNRSEANLEEIGILTTLRDRLLPKLMSGEIRVRDAEKLVGEAV